MKHTMLSALSLATFLAIGLAPSGLARADETTALERLESAVSDQSSLSYSTQGELREPVFHQEETKLRSSPDGCSLTLTHVTKTIASVGGADETQTSTSIGHLRLDDLQAFSTRVYIGSSCESLSLTGKPEATWPGGCLYVAVQERSGRTLLNKDLVFKFAPTDRDLATKVAKELTQAIRACQQDELPLPRFVHVDEGRGVKYTEELSGTPNRQAAAITSARLIR